MRQRVGPVMDDAGATARGLLRAVPLIGFRNKEPTMTAATKPKPKPKTVRPATRAQIREDLSTLAASLYQQLGTAFDTIIAQLTEQVQSVVDNSGSTVDAVRNDGDRLILRNDNGYPVRVAVALAVLDWSTARGLDAQRVVPQCIVDAATARMVQFLTGESDD